MGPGVQRARSNQTDVAPNTNPVSCLVTNEFDVSNKKMKQNEKKKSLKLLFLFCKAKSLEISGHLGDDNLDTYWLQPVGRRGKEKKNSDLIVSHDYNPDGQTSVAARRSSENRNQRGQLTIEFLSRIDWGP